VIRTAAAGAGIADAVVVNTCAVTSEAVRQARQTIRRLKRERPDAKIVVTGCAARPSRKPSKTCRSRADYRQRTENKRGILGEPSR
jgi:tRNA A37 methylthiotransferase MiaB